MLLVVSAVHQYLIKKKLRNNCALLCFTGDVIEDHQAACLVAFGASAVYPYIAFELIRETFQNEDWVTKLHNYRFALEKGLLKIMAKMGISTVSSYHGSRLFHAVGVSKSLIEKYFPSVKTTLGGIDMDLLKLYLNERSKKAFYGDKTLEEVGRFRFRKGKEAHGFSPAVFKYIHNVSQQKENESLSDEPPVYVRDLLEVKKNNHVPLNQVESAEDVLKRFGLGAVSFGAISEEAHRHLACSNHSWN